jgi:hypothetical protein
MSTADLLAGRVRPPQHQRPSPYQLLEFWGRHAAPAASALFRKVMPRVEIVNFSVRPRVLFTLGCYIRNTGGRGSRTGASSPVESQSGVPVAGYRDSTPIVLTRTGSTGQRFTLGPGCMASEVIGLEFG